MDIKLAFTLAISIAFFLVILYAFWNSDGRARIGFGLAAAVFAVVSTATHISAYL